MADRKQFLKSLEKDEELETLLRDAPEPSDDQLREQRVSFAYGNALGSPDITKDSVRKTSRSMRLLD